MQIGVIQTGHVRDALAAEHGEYPAMFARLIGPHLPQAQFTTIALIEGALLPAPSACDGWIVTGSRHGVYEDLPWIAPLKTWLRAARRARVPLIGVCFGHQIMAEAFGGRAIKHPGGWRMGGKLFEALARPGWAASLPARSRFYSLHQDQVVEPPKGATTWMRAQGCDYAALIYGDVAAPEAISVQPHPEFSDGFAHDIVKHLLDLNRVPRDLGEAAIAEMGPAVDNQAMGETFAAYLRAAKE